MAVKRIALGTLTVLALLVAGCGSAQDSESAVVEQDASPAADASETPDPEPDVADSPAAEQPLIPAAFQGRWGETEESSACAAGGSGGLTITESELRYEGLGTTSISDVRRIDANTVAIEGRYAETGQAPTKDVEQQLKLSGDGAHLSEVFAGTAPFDYIRC